MATSNKDISEREWGLLANIGALFKEMREESGMTQREAASKLGTSQSRIPVLEQGQADVMITTLQRHASIYGYDLEIAVVKRPEEGEFRLNDDGTMQEYKDGEWAYVVPTKTEILEGDAA